MCVFALARVDIIAGVVAYLYSMRGLECTRPMTTTTTPEMDFACVRALGGDGDIISPHLACARAHTLSHMYTNNHLTISSGSPFFVCVCCQRQSQEPGGKGWRILFNALAPARLACMRCLAALRPCEMSTNALA